MTIKVAINDLGDPATNAHLTQYDTVHGKFPGTVSVDGDCMVVNGDRIRVLANRNPAELPWAELGVDVVMECTGFFTTKEKASAHLRGGCEEGHHLGAWRQGRRCDHRLRGQPQDAESVRHGDLERLVHDQLPGTAGQAFARRDWP